MSDTRRRPCQVAGPRWFADHAVSLQEFYPVPCSPCTGAPRACGEGEFLLSSVPADDGAVPAEATAWIRR